MEISPSIAQIMQINLQLSSDKISTDTHIRHTCGGAILIILRISSVRQFVFVETVITLPTVSVVIWNTILLTPNVYDKQCI